MNTKERSPTITDPFLQQELNNRQPRIRTVYEVPENAPDETVLNLIQSERCYQIHRIGGRWMYQPLFNSPEEIPDA